MNHNQENKSINSVVLENMINNLTEKVETGFAGIHERQNTTNGRIGKSEDRISVIEKWMYTLIGGGVVLGLIPAITSIINQLTK